MILGDFSQLTATVIHVSEHLGMRGSQRLILPERSHFDDTLGASSYMQHFEKYLLKETM